MLGYNNPSIQITFINLEILNFLFIIKNQIGGTNTNTQIKGEIDQEGLIISPSELAPIRIRGVIRYNIINYIYKVVYCLHIHT